MNISTSRSGAIIYVDVVKYSMVPSDEEQLGIIESLEREVRRFMPVRCWSITNAAAFVPTGDGFLLTIPISGELDSNQKVTTLAVALVIHLVKFSKKWRWKGYDSPFLIRAGIHYDEFHERVDMTGRINVVGKGLARGQRILSFATDAHILISEPAYQQLKGYCSYIQHQSGHNNKKNPFAALTKALSTVCDHYEVPYDRLTLGIEEKMGIDDIGQYEDKHGNKYTIYNMFIMGESKGENQCICGIEQPPEPQQRLQLSNHNLKIRLEKFTERLSKATKFTIIGITNERLPDILSNAVKKNPPWSNITVVMLNENLLSGFVEEKRSPAERKQAAKKSMVDLKRLLAKLSIPSRILSFTGNLPFVGTAFDPEDGPSFIQLTLALPGKDLRQGIWFETVSPSQLFNEYDAAIKRIVDQSDVLWSHPPLLN